MSRNKADYLHNPLSLFVTNLFEWIIILVYVTDVQEILANMQMHFALIPLS